MNLTEVDRIREENRAREHISKQYPVCNAKLVKNIRTLALKQDPNANDRQMQGMKTARVEHQSSATKKPLNGYITEKDILRLAKLK